MPVLCIALEWMERAEREKEASLRYGGLKIVSEKIVSEVLQLCFMGFGSHSWFCSVDHSATSKGNYDLKRYECLSRTVAELLNGASGVQQALVSWKWSS